MEGRKWEGKKNKSRERKRERKKMSKFMRKVIKGVSRGEIKLDVCQLSKELKDVEITEKHSSSNTEVLFAKLAKKALNLDENVPIAIKMWIDLKKIPEELLKELKLHKYVKGIEGLEYEARVYEDIINKIIERDESPNFVGFLGYGVCRGRGVKKYMENDDQWEEVKKGLVKSYGKGILELPQLPVSLLITTKVEGEVTTMGKFMKRMQKRMKDLSGLLERNKKRGGDKKMEGKLRAQKFDIEIAVKEVLFQVVYSLAVMQKYRLVHNDLHLENVMIKKMKKPQVRTYIIGGDVYVTNTRYFPLIFDWDNAYSELLGDNPSLKGYPCREYNICNRFNRKVDLYILLCTLKFPKFDYITIKKPRATQSIESKEKIPLERKELAELLDYPQYIKERELYKMGRGQLQEIIGKEKYKKYLGDTVSVMFKMERSYDKNTEYKYNLRVIEGFRCRPVAFDSDMPTPLEMIRSATFSELKFSTGEFDINKIIREVRGTDNVYIYPESMKLPHRIYRDPFIDTRAKIKGKPTFKRREKSGYVRTRPHKLEKLPNQILGKGSGRRGERKEEAQIRIIEEEDLNPMIQGKEEDSDWELGSGPTPVMLGVDSDEEDRKEERYED